MSGESPVLRRVRHGWSMGTAARPNRLKFAAVRKSANGTKRTYRGKRSLVRFRGEADIDETEIPQCSIPRCVILFIPEHGSYWDNETTRGARQASWWCGRCMAARGAHAAAGQAADHWIHGPGDTYGRSQTSSGFC